MNANTSLVEELLPRYVIRPGSILERALLVKFMQLTYQDMFPGQSFSHLRQTVEQYFSDHTPLWWVDFIGMEEEGAVISSRAPVSPTPVASLWIGNAIDQVTGDRHAHVFLLYVVPEHRRKGVGTALMQYAENWAKKRGDRQIGLQVFPSNQAALNLYTHLGYQTQSFWMLKPLD